MKMTLNLPEPLRRQMQVAAAQAGYNSASAWLRDLIRRELAREAGPTTHSPEGQEGRT